MGKQAKISDSTIDYEVVYRTIKYPRLEFRTGELLLVLPESHKDHVDIIEKHEEWIHNRNSEIITALENSKKKTLDFKRTDEDFRHSIHSIVENISDSLKIDINNIYFRKMKSKWGSCSARKNLTINTLLRYLPDSLIEYVIYHEMVHLIEKKHNERFWRFISNKFENYNENEKELFEYWFLIQKVAAKAPPQPSSTPSPPPLS